MSLWYKSPSEITFADVDAFCQTMQPEGYRLDYKVQMPTDLAKTIAAFANTLGGLIIIGVDSEKTSNTPTWPPKTGMPIDAGISERIIAIARDGIHPSVRVDVSPVIENAKLPGHAIVVVRVDESRFAPHAVERRTKVYVYERSDNQTAPHTLADVDRIDYLLKRRDEAVNRRERELKTLKNRCLKRLEPNGFPIRWASVAPLFPWQDIINRDRCRQFHDIQPFGFPTGLNPYYQRAPGGSMAIGRGKWSAGDQHTSAIAASFISALGIGVSMSLTLESQFTDVSSTMPGDPTRQIHSVMVNVAHLRDQTNAVATAMASLYKAANMKPGEVIVSMGLRNALNVRMHYDTFKSTKSMFPDDEYQADVPMSISEFLDDPTKATGQLLAEIQYAFDL